jgi:hypothetical protein
MRGVGYSTGAALADLVDNSIAAGATNVSIQFNWSDGGHSVTLLDDGKGMSDPELHKAMTLGSRSPLEQRSASDLGRFGMGLKTASLSQCRRLTVASVQGGIRSCLRWDLDHLAANQQLGWSLIEGPEPGSEGLLKILDGRPNGTLVVWECLDRIVGPGFTSTDFASLTFEVERHLAMVFHRWIGGRDRRLTLSINDAPVNAWDPFMTGHPAKSWNSPVQRLQTADGPILVECHVLPHKDRLSPEEFAEGGGPGGWAAQQGFYVYRNDRLILAGGWLGLGQGRAWNREEAYRLARVRIDIPNSADASWRIDIKKSVARPPAAVRGWLTKLAEDTRNRARKVFAYRGSPISSVGGQSVDLAWRVEQLKSGIRYRVDLKHPVVAAAVENAGQDRELVLAMIRVIEETVPVQRIWLDTAENKDTPSTGFVASPPAEISAVLSTLFEDMTGRQGMAPADARRVLKSTEPFQSYPALVDAIGR